MFTEKDFIEKTITRTPIFDGKIIKVAVDEVELPQGLGVSTRELVFHPGGVCVIALTDEEELVLVKQFRKPFEKVIFEIPAGKIEPGEQDDLENAAKRELEEETSYVAGLFEKVCETYLSPGFCDECLHFYFARQLSKVENPRPQDDDEVVEVHTFSLKEAKRAIEDGRICDAKTVMAVWYWELQTMRKRFEEKG